MKIGQMVLKLSNGNQKWRRTDRQTDRRTDGNPSFESITNSFTELTDPENVVFGTKITFLSAIFLDI